MRDDADAHLNFEPRVRLMPCPFCGSVELVHTNESDIYGRGAREMIACGSCGTQGPWGMDEDDASARWNKRLSTNPI